jgi:uncharacterized membrane protein YhaH (DUF805 family)
MSNSRETKQIERYLPFWALGEFFYIVAAVLIVGANLFFQEPSASNVIPDLMLGVFIATIVFTMVPGYIALRPHEIGLRAALSS